MSAHQSGSGGGEGVIELELTAADAPLDTAVGFIFGVGHACWPTLTGVGRGSPVAKALQQAAARGDGGIDPRGLTLIRIRGPGCAHTLPTQLSASTSTFHGSWACAGLSHSCDL